MMIIMVGKSHIYDSITGAKFLLDILKCLHKGDRTMFSYFFLMAKKFFFAKGGYVAPKYAIGWK